MVLRFDEPSSFDNDKQFILLFRNMSNNNNLIKLSNIFKALGNTSRLEIFLRLASCCRPGPTNHAASRLCVGELGSSLGLAPSTVSHHVKELRRAGLLNMTRAGKTVECWVDPGTLESLSQFFNTAGYE